MPETTQSPFYVNSIFTIYNNYSFVTGIIQGNNNGNFEPWAYGRYINCMITPQSNFFSIGTLNDVWKANSDFVKIIRYRGKRLIPHEKVAHFQSLISQGYYIMCIMNEQYVKGTDAHNYNFKFMHDTLITGYDLDEQAFTIYVRLSDQNLHSVKLPFDDFEKAVSSGSWSFTLKYNDEKSNSLNICLIREELSHYLYSSPSIKHIKLTKFGLSAVEMLCKYLVAQYHSRKHIDYRFTKGLAEQKALMFNMCKYLNTNGYNLSENILTLCKESADAAQKIHLLALKSYANVKSNHNLGERIKKQFDVIIHCERKYIPMLLKQLSDY